MAHRAGYPHLRHMAAELTSSEMTELHAFYLLEPDMGRRIDEGFARLMHLIWQVSGQKKRRDVDSFMPKRGPLDRKKVAVQVMGQFDLMRQIHAARKRKQDG